VGGENYRVIPGEAFDQIAHFDNLLRVKPHRRFIQDNHRRVMDNRLGKGRLVVIGDSEFVADGLFNLQRNGDVFLNSVNWLAQNEAQPLSIRSKDPTNRRLNIATPLATSVTLLALIGLPGGALVAAAVVWWRRR